MHDQIFELVKAKGPVLPSEISGKVDIDSFLMNAYLDELVEKGKIKATSERIGTSFIYFMPGQEAAAKKKLSDLKDQDLKTTSTFKTKKPVRATPEIEKKRVEFQARLERIEKEESELKKRKPKVEVIKKDPSKPFKFAKKILKKTVDTISKPEVEQESSPTPSKKSPSIDQFVQMSQDYLKEKGIEILTAGEKTSQKDAEFTANVPSNVGPVKFLVKIKRKKRINKTDLTLIYAEALERRMPALLLTDAALAQTALDYLKDLKGFVRVKTF